MGERVYEILVCPVCREQLSEDFYEGGYCPEHRDAEATRVEVTIAPTENPSLELGAFRYQELRRDGDWNLAAQRLINGMTDEQRREYLSPMAYALDRSTRDYFERTAEMYRNSPFLRREPASGEASERG